MKLQSPLAIETEGLVKRFGDKIAVDGIDLAVRAGTVYGVLGPNGAGKTTTIRMLATLLRPDGGSARVLGHDVVAEPQAVRSCVSSVELAWVLAWSAALVAVFAPLTMRLYNKER